MRSTPDSGGEKSYLGPATSRLSQVPCWVWLALVWAVLYLIPVGFRSLYWEEGRRALMALDILREGHWLQPRVWACPI